MKVSDLIDMHIPGYYKWDVIEQIPEFAKLKECEQSAKWHKEGNVWIHTKRVCEEAIKLIEKNEAFLVRKGFAETANFLAAALFHDIGKGTTTTFQKGDWHAYGHEFESEKITRKILWDESDREDICSLVRWHMAILNVGEKRFFDEILHIARNVPSMELLLSLKKCDIMGSIAESPNSKDWRKISDIEYACRDLGIYYIRYKGKPASSMASFKSFTEKSPIGVYVMIGLPGSGKSTKAKAFADNTKDIADFVILSRDSIRAELGYCSENEKVVLSKEQEDEVTKIFNERLLKAANNGSNIIIDNLNLKKKYRDGYKELLNGYNVIWTYWICDTHNIDINLERRKGQIGKDIMESMILGFDYPLAEEYDILRCDTTA